MKAHVRFHVVIKGEIQIPDDLPVGDRNDQRAEAFVCTRLSDYFSGGMGIVVPGLTKAKATLSSGLWPVLVCDPWDAPGSEDL